MKTTRTRKRGRRTRASKAIMHWTKRRKPRCTVAVPLAAVAVAQAVKTIQGTTRTEEWSQMVSPSPLASWVDWRTSVIRQLGGRTSIAEWRASGRVRMSISIIIRPTIWTGGSTRHLPSTTSTPGGGTLGRATPPPPTTRPITPPELLSLMARALAISTPKTATWPSPTSSPMKTTDRWTVIRPPVLLRPPPAGGGYPCWRRRAGLSPTTRSRSRSRPAPRRAGMLRAM
mmetsp:Transcript_54875/g.164231  ORF Transcript_54875/g.164231 Transcript_54875/m.164231 type:complete len:229 (+) Transcript_54875:1603-2289(+)